jgi:hypothetical protein
MPPNPLTILKAMVVQLKVGEAGASLGIPSVPPPSSLSYSFLFPHPSPPSSSSFFLSSLPFTLLSSSLTPSCPVSFLPHPQELVEVLRQRAVAEASGKNSSSAAAAAAGAAMQRRESAGGAKIPPAPLAAAPADSEASSPPSAAPLVAPPLVSGAAASVGNGSAGGGRDSGEEKDAQAPCGEKLLLMYDR